MKKEKQARAQTSTQIRTQKTKQLSQSQKSMAEKIYRIIAKKAYEINPDTAVDLSTALHDTCDEYQTALSELMDKLPEEDPVTIPSIEIDAATAREIKKYLMSDECCLDRSDLVTVIDALDQALPE